MEIKSCAINIQRINSGAVVAGSLVVDLKNLRMEHDGTHQDHGVKSKKTHKKDTKKRKVKKRRCKSPVHISRDAQTCIDVTKAPSQPTDSSWDEEDLMVVKDSCLKDSNTMSDSGETLCGAFSRQLSVMSMPKPSVMLVESDSYTENCVPKKPHRRRKFKRMVVDVDPDMDPLSMSVCDDQRGTAELRRNQRRKAFSISTSGKSKTRKQLDPGMEVETAVGQLAESLQASCCMATTSSSQSDLSETNSDGSDDGTYTNDEGGEGDDEESEWEEVNTVNQERGCEDENSKFDQASTSLLDAVTTSKRLFKARMDRCTLSHKDREIRLARRHLRNWKKCSPLPTDFKPKCIDENDKSLLWLRSVRKDGQKEIMQLARGYSLTLRHESSQNQCVILKKNRCLPSFTTGKRRKKAESSK